MPRPIRNKVDYFPHDANASDSDTLTILQGRFGNDGYAFWFRLLEKLSTAENHIIDCRNPIKWQLLLAKSQLSEEAGSNIMDCLVELEAIDAELWLNSKVIWCQNLVNNLSSVYQNRRRELPLKPVVTPISTRKKPVTTIESTQSKVKYSIVDNIYIDIFNMWNELRIIKHTKLTNDIKKAIDSTLKDYTQEEIIQAINNYSIIVKGEEYYFNHKWTLAEFLSRNKHNNIERFLDLEIAKQNFLKDRDNGKNKPRQLPKTYTRPEDL